MKANYVGALCACALSIAVSVSADAALIGRDLDGNLSTSEAYYDTSLGITWLADANYAGTTMNWTTANAWATGLNINGITGWTLPTSDTCLGYSCTGSQMGSLFYTTLGNPAGGPLSNTGPFSNVQSDYYYWSATEYAPSTSEAWYFSTGNGYQDFNIKANSFYAWAVHAGDVGASAVPVPAAVWLLGSGLLGLVSVKRQR